MISRIEVVSLPLLLFTLACFMGLSVYLTIAQFKIHRRQRHIATINAAIIDYFAKSGVQVRADSTQLKPKSGFTVVIESEPMKRFRLSHIIEMTLREHVSKTCNLTLDKVYWRFPVKNVLPQQPAANDVHKEQDSTPPDEATVQSDKKTEEEERDAYINEGLEHVKYLPTVEATELSWEHFEQVTVIRHEQKLAE